MMKSTGLEPNGDRFTGLSATYRFPAYMRNLYRRANGGLFACCVSFCLLALTACSSQPQRTYVDPQGTEAGQCLQICQSQRFTCRTPIQRLDEDCQYRYRIAYSQFQRCLQIRGNRGGCTKPRGCSVPNYTACAVGYDQCFVGCGGQILTDDDNYRDD